MFRTYAFLVIFVHITSSLQEIDFQIIRNTTEKSSSFHENILCRGCGNDISFSSSIISKISPNSQYSYHDSLFSRDRVLIQILESEFFFPYPMITTTHSNCAGISEWEETDSWYPGYRWKLCVCPDCGAHVGWVFESINSNFVTQPRTFFGLILTSLIGESCKYSLFR